MKKASLGRQERRRAAKAAGVGKDGGKEFLRLYVEQERLAGRLFTAEDVNSFLETEKQAGRLYDMERVVALLNDNTRRAIQIVFTAMMESHICGASRILRDIDPVVMGMFKDLERMTREDGLDYANAKMAERYQLAKRRSYRPIKGLEHLIGGDEDDL